MTCGRPVSTRILPVAAQREQLNFPNVFSVKDDALLGACL